LNGRSCKLAVFAGSVGAALTIFMITVYYIHLVGLSEVPLERMRYTATIYASAIALFTLSLSMNLLALLTSREPKSSRLMAVSAIASFVGYIFPCERLIRFNYAVAFYETLIIAAIHIVLLAVSSVMLRRKCKSGT
jgi:hypothetical protein